MNLTSQSKKVNNKLRSHSRFLPGMASLFLYHIQVSQVSPHNFRKFSPHALKGQKLLAQGSALGIMAISKTPCKGKSFKISVNF